MSQRNTVMPAKAGMICGTMPKAMTWIRLAPVASMASTWFWSISSIASYRSLATKPIERREMAMTPANRPGPTMETSNKAQIRELMEREDTMINNATGRTNLALGVVLRAARNATGTAMTMENIVPSVAMFMVSQIGSQSFSA